MSIIKISYITYDVLDDVALQNWILLANDAASPISANVSSSLGSLGIAVGKPHIWYLSRQIL
jgi:hypothetical protein